MKREELIKKWLDNNLNSEEQIAFEQLEDYNDLVQLDNAIKSFKSPEFSADENYEGLKSGFNNRTPKQWYKPLLRIAAILVICFSIYFYVSSLDTSINTEIAEKTNIELPDTSSINLNSNSQLTYNEKNWVDNRIVRLNGEAFFKVAKGKTFDVITDNGTVSVLGTQFNVKQRNNYFEVTCYEGLVAVTYKNNRVKLPPGNKLRIIDGKLLATEKEIATQPSWLRGESSFNNIALKHVISELENQYNIKVSADGIDTSRIFTGSFTHKNLDLALKSIVIPLNLSYIKSRNSILLKRE